MNTEYIYEKSDHDDSIGVHAITRGVEQRFILVVKDVSSLNPSIQINNPLHIAVVKKILNHLYENMGVPV